MRHRCHAVRPRCAISLAVRHDAVTPAPSLANTLAPRHRCLRCAATATSQNRFRFREDYLAPRRNAASHRTANSPSSDPADLRVRRRESARPIVLFCAKSVLREIRIEDSTFHNLHCSGVFPVRGRVGAGCARPADESRRLRDCMAAGLDPDVCERVHARRLEHDGWRTRLWWLRLPGQPTRRLDRSSAPTGRC